MNVPPVRVNFTDDDREEILARIADSLTTGSLTLGKNVREFEAAFSEAIEAPHCVAVSSGTAAIEIAMRILGADGREVIVPANTFMATASAVVNAGGYVRFADADPETFSIGPAQIERLINDSTAGVIVVHIGGLVTPKMPEIQKLCQDRGVWLFEDAAHAHGSVLGDKFAGSFGAAAAFSFYPTKIITSGEGGMLATADENIKRLAEKYRDQGKRSFNENLHDVYGSNWRMSEPHAAIGIHHLKHLWDFIDERNDIAAFYDQVLGELPGIEPLCIPDGVICNYYKYIAMLENGIDRAALKRRLREEWEIGLSGEVYEVPCHRQPAFSNFVPIDPLPNAEDICARHVCLPIYNGMTEEEMCYTAQGLTASLKAEREKKDMA